jgi:hypothetical protein
MLRREGVLHLIGHAGQMRALLLGMSLGHVMATNRKIHPVIPAHVSTSHKVVGSPRLRPPKVTQRSLFGLRQERIAFPLFLGWPDYIPPWPTEVT